MEGDENDPQNSSYLLNYVNILQKPQNYFFLLLLLILIFTLNKAHIFPIKIKS